MNSAMPDILAAALALPDGDRAVLAYELLGSLAPDAARNADDPALAVELNRRIAALDAGDVQASDWHDAEQRLRKALDERRKS